MVRLPGYQAAQDWLFRALTAQIIKNTDADGRFESALPVTTGSGVMGVTAGDFNGDGKPDQAIVNSTTLAILLNNGSGGFTAGASYSFPAGYSAKGVVVGNFTGHLNSVLDLAVILAPSGGVGSYSVRIYTGVGDGTFLTPIVSSAGNGTYSSNKRPRTCGLCG